MADSIGGLWQIQSMDCGKFNRWIVASLIGDLSEKEDRQPWSWYLSGLLEWYQS